MSDASPSPDDRKRDALNARNADCSGPHPATLGEDELLAACEVRFMRRGGPGGQHRNKVETAVLLKHLPSGVSAEASEERSQAENRRLALFRLRLLLAVEVRTPMAEVVSPLWLARCRGGRISVSSDHRDLPALLAEALNALAAHDYQTSPAAAQLSVTTSQLIGLLRQHPPALAALNQQREARGNRPLK